TPMPRPPARVLVRPLTRWDVLVCGIGIVVLVGSAVAEEGVLLPLLAFLLLTQVLLRALMGLLPIVGPILWGPGVDAEPPSGGGRSARETIRAVAPKLQEGRFAEALADLSQAERRQAEDASIALLQAWCHRELAQYDEAARVLEAGVSRTPE